jgi:hypothetical protein
MLEWVTSACATRDKAMASVSSTRAGTALASSVHALTRAEVLDLPEPGLVVTAG